jgi:2-dehydropantoate 2-reductase
MRFIVYGAGAIGGVIAARLFEQGSNVVGIARGTHHDAWATRGLRVLDPERDVTLPVPVAGHPDEITFEEDDVLILAMKTQDTEPALRALAARAPQEVAIVCAQNGVENERIALRYFPNVYGMCVMCPTSHLEAGVVEASSTPITGLLDLGRYPHGIDATAKAIADALQAATFESIPRPDIMRWKYAKLLMNLGNAAQALCAPTEGLAELTRRARSEGSATLRAAGIDVASREEDETRRGELLQPKPIGDRPRGGGSSWQSLHRGTGHIETDYLNGEIVRLGRMHDVATPVNAMLQARANDAARRRLPPGSTTAEALLALLS